jgi:hypothetical protein
MRKWIKSWLFREELEKQRQEVHAVLGTRSGIYIEQESTAVQPHVRLGRLNVMNGQLLEVSTYKRNPNGPDWTTDYYIVDPEQKLSDQIATVMVMKGLEK